MDIVISGYFYRWKSAPVCCGDGLITTFILASNLLRIHTMKKSVILALLLCSLCSTAVFAQEYKLSILPRYFPEKLTAMMTPLADYLSKQTGFVIKPVLTDNFTDYETRLLKGDIAIGYENPLVYVKVATTHEVLARAVKGKGGDRFRGIIITRPDSGITRLSALKGKNIMIVGKTSAGGYLSQKLTLMKNGINVDKECQLSVAADNRQENVIISVSIGDVDAGFIRESALHKADQFIMPGSITSIKETAWLPNWAFSVNKNLPQEVKASLQKAILKLPRNSEVLQAMGLTSFVSASNADYNIMRKVAE